MLTMKQVDDRLRRLSGRYTKINDDVQDMAVAIVDHANKTGDCDRARKLVRILPPKMRPLLTGWFSEVSPINVTMGKTVAEDKASLRKEGKRNYNPFDIDKAKANVWHLDPFKKAPVVEKHTLTTFTESAERLFDKIARETKADSDKIEDDDKNLCALYREHMRAAHNAFLAEHQDALPEEIEAEAEALAANAAEEMAAAAA